MDKTIESVTEAIASRANKHASEIICQAEKKAEELLASAKEDITSINEKELKAYEKEKSEQVEKSLKVALLDIKKAELAEKQKLIDAAFARTLDRIKNMDEDEYVDLMVKLLAASDARGNEEIVLNQRDRGQIGKKFCSRANKAFDSQGRLAKFTLSERTGSFACGFILSNGGVEYNSTIEMLLRLIRSQIEGDVAQVLFKEN